MRQASTVGSVLKAACIPPTFFQSLTLTQPEDQARRRSAMLFVSAGLHATLAVAVAVLPLLLYGSMPNTDVLEAFFPTPLQIEVPPPPPAPPIGVRGPTRTVRNATAQARAFVAPADIQTEVEPEDVMDLGPGEGDPNGVIGGVPRGVNVGSIVGGLPPAEAPRPTTKVVRIGGKIARPTLVRRVEPTYPELARAAGVSALVILEAEVDTFGHVRTVKVLRGHPLLDETAVETVKQWRYQALLLNGEPTGFILTVTINFQLHR